MEIPKHPSKSYSNLYRSHSDLNIMNFGRIEMQPGQEISQKTVAHYSFYYIAKGRVSLSLNKKEYTINEGEMFLAPASYPTGFIADSTLTTVFYWVSFWGSEAKSYLDQANMTVDNPIFSQKNAKLYKYMEMLIEECMEHNAESDARALGCLYMLLSETLSICDKKLTNQQISKLSYAKQAIEYIRQYYMHDINVYDISAHLALNRTYFSSLFKDVVGISPVEYLIKYRIDQASMLLTNPLLSVTKIAELVGFNDLITFSRRFKAFNSVSPSEYRKLVFDKYAPRLRATEEKSTKKH